MKMMSAAIFFGAISCGAWGAPPSYDITRLLPPKGANLEGWRATDLNASGVVVGYNFRGPFRGTIDHGFKRLPTAPSLTDYSYAMSVDAEGNVAGNGIFEFPNTTATLFPRSGPAENLGALIPESDFSQATSISARGGWVVGHYQALVGRRSIYPAFIWSKSTGMQRIGDTGDAYTILRDVNDAGHAVGSSDSKAIFWSAETGSVQIPGAIEGLGINNRDEVTGYIPDPENGGYPMAFVQPHHSPLVRLERPAGLTKYCYGKSINKLSQVVGSCTSDDWGTSDHAVLWWPEQGAYVPVDLNVQAGLEDRSLIQRCNDLDDNRHGQLDYSADAVNDVGQILVQVQCYYQYLGGSLNLGFASLVLTPRSEAL